MVMGTAVSAGVARRPSANTLADITLMKLWLPIEHMPTAVIDSASSAIRAGLAVPSLGQACLASCSARSVRDRSPTVWSDYPAHGHASLSGD